jgi:hypothetical protein
MKRFAVLVGVVALALLAASQVQAAFMTWRAPVQISGDSDVVTDGTLVAAYSVGATSSTTVNGVTFEALPIVQVSGWANPVTASYAVISSDPFESTPPGTTRRYNNIIDAGDSTGAAGAFAGLSSPYKQLLGHAAMSKGLEFYDDWSRSEDWLPAPAAVTLTGLTPGKMYLFQDWQQGSARSWTLTSGGATSDVIAAGDSVAGSLGQHITGTFVADSTTQRIDWLANAPDHWEYNIVNGFQVREVVPEPGTIVLAFTGLIGLLCYAWRKRK